MSHKIYSKTIALNKDLAIISAKFIALLGLATFSPFFFNQSITGVIVNAVLIITTVLIGFRSAFLVAVTPSIIAYSIGFSPSALLPMVPFIMVGNLILIFVFYFFYKKNYWLASATAAFLKFTFLFLTSRLIAVYFLPEAMATKISVMMGAPQFFTAIGGAVVAFIFLKFIKKL